MPRKEQNIESTPYPDGLREGVLNDSAGVQIGITNTNETINPANIASKNKNFKKEKSSKNTTD